MSLYSARCPSSKPTVKMEDIKSDVSLFNVLLSDFGVFQGLQTEGFRLF